MICDKHQNDGRACMACENAALEVERNQLVEDNRALQLRLDRLVKVAAENERLRVENIWYQKRLDIMAASSKAATDDGTLKE